MDAAGRVAARIRGSPSPLDERTIGAGSGQDVVFVSSASAELPWPLHAAYAGSKAGVEQAARSLALELEGTGVRATVIRVGNTAGTAFAADWQPAELQALAEWQRLGILRHGGLLSPEQVAEAIVWTVGMPRSVQLDLVSVQPEAPVVERAAPQSS